MDQILGHWPRANSRLHRQEVSRVQSAMWCPQGSLLGPILFLLYCAEVTRNVHSYADDTQPYIPCDVTECATASASLSSCIEELESWMTSNRLKMNADKTQFIWTGSRQQVHAKMNIAAIVLKGHQIVPECCVECLGVFIDTQFDICATCQMHRCKLFVADSSALEDTSVTICRQCQDTGTRSSCESC